MGGASTEISATTTDVLLEAAHWQPDSIARTVRRHKLPSEAARRFERDVDPHIAGVNRQRERLGRRQTATDRQTVVLAGLAVGQHQTGQISGDNLHAHLQLAKVGALEFVDRLPRSPLGKLLRKDLRDPSSASPLQRACPEGHNGHNGHNGKERA